MLITEAEVMAIERAFMNGWMRKTNKSITAKEFNRIVKELASKFAQAKVDYSLFQMILNGKAFPYIGEDGNVHFEILDEEPGSGTGLNYSP